MVFINEATTTGVTGQVQVELAGEPGADISGYRLAGYGNDRYGGTEHKGTLALPVGTVLDSGGLYAATHVLGTKFFAAFSLHLPDAMLLAQTGFVEGVSLFDYAIRPAGGPSEGQEPFQSYGLTGSGVSVQKVGVGERDGSGFTWAVGASSFGSLNAGQSWAADAPPPPDPEGPEDPDVPELPSVPAPGDLGREVARFLTGYDDDAAMVAACETAAGMVLAMARNYTRGNGFVGDAPAPAIRHVVVAASARLAANPEQLESQVGTAIMRGAFTGWSALERVILDSYRVTAV